jgi:isochorismate synthase EntC
MAINPAQFKTKPKRKYNGPRPNLMKHDKQLRENSEVVDAMQRVIDSQQRQIDRLQNRLATLESTVTIIGYSIKNN